MNENKNLQGSENDTRHDENTENSGYGNDAARGGLGRDQSNLQGSDTTQGSSYNPNDASGVRSGGTTDMDDQMAGGAGLAGERLGGGTNINTKRNVSGSDFDGQNASS